MSRFAIVVDNSLPVRHALCRALEERGFIVESAINADEAVALARSRPHLLVLNLELKDLQGRQVAALIRSRPQAAGVPVIGLTASHRASPDLAAADFVIYKDQGIDQQLDQALAAVETYA